MKPPEPETVTPFFNQAQRDILLAAAGGSLLSLLFAGEPFTWRQAATAIAAGIFSAYYGVELLAGGLHLGPGWFGALGAAFGFGAMTILGGVLKLLRMWRDDPSGTLERFLPWIKKGG